ncbi:hypothetical protein J7E79_25430 [Bacillus sp. ISL-40]|uniref:hypothetical protein n=1 Tax=unclassified Bacillus (in: firmicutes) TaxID=185979 RepID=UPI001BE8423B|nr:MULTISPECIES: hypothetical protein [unclassified Bacillus (in: firmicutes)]MBT2700683.1 hypothetical protein [Bacillus sp. ISL-40]MBT2744458.1 hypothetical protein [Bacillus sp. ISL-77]
MKQSIYGLLLLLALILPPVANLMESVLVIHMHMQMPLLIFTGFLIARFFQLRFPHFFEKWNGNGVPGILLFVIIVVYWTLPRSMDEALNEQSMELFKFVSLPFLAGIALRDSWKKLRSIEKDITFYLFVILFFGMGWLYIDSPVQLCNNYLVIEQITLGWGFLTMAICMVIYKVYIAFVDPSKYE